MDFINIIFIIALLALLAQIPIWIWAIVLIILFIGVLRS
jgi:hypothetical protein